MMATDITREIGVKAGRVIEIRRYGNYVNTVENTTDALKSWLVANMPPTEGTPKDATGVRISPFIGFRTLVYHAQRAGFTFNLIKTPTK